MNKQQQWNIWYVVGAFMMLMLFQSVWTTYRTVEAIPYSDFVKFLNEGRSSTSRSIRNRSPDASRSR